MKHALLIIAFVIVCYVGWQFTPAESKAKILDVFKRHVGSLGLLLLLAVMLISWFLNSRPVKLF